MYKKKPLSSWSLGKRVLFPSSLDGALNFVSRNIEILWKRKLKYFPRDSVVIFLFVTWPILKMPPYQPMQDGWQELKGKVCFSLSNTAGYQTSMNKTGFKKVPFLEFL